MSQTKKSAHSSSSVSSNAEVSLSRKAAAELKKIMKKEHKEGWFLKLGDVEGHCGGGYGYELKLVPEVSSSEEVYKSQGVQICVPKQSLKRLSASSIEFDGGENQLFEGLLSSGFKIDNPNVKAPCICGCERGFSFA